ncbi:MAG TPA: hypothetical protein PKD37_07700 [Oligoflexia bacterium]|nr:hypothetical protein [Oligoflexia bacterium]HMP27847.1 hypothetical protein [Oligoflexia bacterium]
MKNITSINSLNEIIARLEYLGGSAEWIAKESVHLDGAISQTATLICAVADQIKQKVSQLVSDLTLDDSATDNTRYH